MVSKGLSRDRLKVANYGESKPIKSDDIAANRRVEFKVLEK
jgi:outer membrane protein OmpA-like peptidoglycan-associated protein